MNDKQDLLAGCHHDPFAYLGMHPCDDRVVVRAFLPHAESVQVAALGSDILAACERVDDAGLFEARLEASDLFAYELVVSRQGHRRRVRDPYSFWPMVSSYDQHLFASGAHLRIHEVLGAHLRDVAGVAGVHFCVWAPGGRRVSVIGDFNDWDGRVHPMLSVGDSGLWELFLPDLTADTVYKYEILTQAGDVLEKADPCAQAAEIPPRTASRVASGDEFAWSDDQWLEQRGEKR
ncbi:MAG: hypothetical protein VX528_07590 [Candidatus Latescibacterota bacterium]|nr:hypothetical protein [Candidatus Latescibacterota bacterium]